MKSLRDNTARKQRLASYQITQSGKPQLGALRETTQIKGRGKPQTSGLSPAKLDRTASGIIYGSYKTTQRSKLICSPSLQSPRLDKSKSLQYITREVERNIYNI